MMKIESSSCDYHVVVVSEIMKVYGRREMDKEQRKKEKR